MNIKKVSLLFRLHTPHYGKDVPFEVPQGWRWCRLFDIAYFGGGKTPSTENKEYWNGEYLWVTSKDMKHDVINNSILKVSEKGKEELELYPPKTILIVVRSGILRRTLPLAILESSATINQDLKAICPYNPALPNYIYYYLKANEDYILKNYQKDGTTVESINFEKFQNIEIAIPPLGEQQRIVVRIEKWFTLIDALESDTAELQAHIKQAKSKILDLAIHGKLVPQNPDDEPASELLNRINPDAKITCDNAHSRKLPQGWCYCSLENLFTITMGQSPSGDSINQKDGIEFHQGKIQFTEKYLSRSLFFTNTPTKMAVPNSILLCVRAPVGVINITKRQICIGRGLCSLQPISILNLDFAFYSLLTYKSQLDAKSTGTTFKAISGDIIKKELFYLPPYQEQQRIVQKIEELFSLLNDIQEALEA